MLEEVRISGLGVIDEAVLEFSPGFNVVTGETGAGKTMVVTGLGLLFGGRADPSRVRPGADRASVEGRLRVDPDGEVAKQVNNSGGDLDDEGSALVLNRSVSAEGRSRAFAGGRSVPVSLLTYLADDLVAVHGQADQQQLLRPGRQREALDRFAGPELTSLRGTYQRAHSQHLKVRAELDELTAQARERTREADALRHGLAEVERLEPAEGEDIDLHAEAERLSNADALHSAATAAHEALVSDPSSGSYETADALTLLGTARHALEAAAEHDPALAALAARLGEAAYLVSDVAAELASYGESIEADPIRLAAVQDRRAELTRLIRVYGSVPIPRPTRQDPVHAGHLPDAAGHEPETGDGQPAAGPGRGPSTGIPRHAGASDGGTDGGSANGSASEPASADHGGEETAASVAALTAEAGDAARAGGAGKAGGVGGAGEAEATHRAGTAGAARGDGTRGAHEVGAGELVAVLAWAKGAAARLAELEGDDDRIADLEKQEAELAGTVRELGAQLTEARKDAAVRFETEVTAELVALAMPHARLSAAVNQLREYGPHGGDDVEIRLAAHPGAPALPLHKGASGGELSRVMLAIEVVFAGADPVPTFVFDEVDAGVGGKAAVEIGRRLARLARLAQVIVVTHLPQVAAFADTHLVVEKSGDGSVTSSGVSRLEQEGRVRELSRMLAGLEDSEFGRAHAGELLAAAAAERATAERVSAERTAAGRATAGSATVERTAAGRSGTAGG